MGWDIQFVLKQVAEGVETEIVQVGSQQVRGCVACGGCAKLGRCVYDDAVNQLAPKFEACDERLTKPVYHIPRELGRGFERKTPAGFSSGRFACWSPLWDGWAGAYMTTQ